MSRTVYVNGEYLPEGDAKVSIFDRGFVMADGVYEVVSVLDGKLIDFPGHQARLNRSLEALEIGQPMTDDDYLTMFRELVAKNQIGDGMIYLQVTRGNPGDRDFAYPPKDTPQTVVAFTQSKPGLADNPVARTGWRMPAAAPCCATPSSASFPCRCPGTRSVALPTPYTRCCAPLRPFSASGSNSCARTWPPPSRSPSSAVRITRSSVHTR